MFAPGHLGELTRIIPFEMVDEVLAETGKTQQRICKLPSRVVVYLLLAAALFEDLGYRGIWRKLIAGLDGIATANPSGPGLRQARIRIGVAPLKGPVRPGARSGLLGANGRCTVVRPAGVRPGRHHHGRP